MALSLNQISSAPISSIRHISVGDVSGERKARGVVSDVVIQTDDLTEESFSVMFAQENPYGYGIWRSFIEGDYSYRYAIFKVKYSTSQEMILPVTSSLKLTVDVPDVNDYGTVAVSAASGTKVWFKKTFVGTPTVNATTISGTDVCYPRVTEITNEYFVVQLTDGSGNLMSATIAWWAEGY